VSCFFLTGTVYGSLRANANDPINTVAGLLQRRSSLYRSRLIIVLKLMQTARCIFAHVEFCGPPFSVAAEIVIRGLVKCHRVASRRKNYRACIYEHLVLFGCSC